MLRPCTATWHLHHFSMRLRTTTPLRWHNTLTISAPRSVPISTGLAGIGKIDVCYVHRTFVTTLLAPSTRHNQVQGPDTMKSLHLPMELLEQILREAITVRGRRRARRLRLVNGEWTILTRFRILWSCRNFLQVSFRRDM
jgi:hypothetical protein